MQNCLICQIHAGEVSVPGGAIYTDDFVYARHLEIAEGKSTVYAGHLILETQRHVSELADLSDEEAKAIGLMTVALSGALRDGEGAEHVYLYLIADQVQHVHLHLVPRYPGTPREYWGLRLDEWQQAPQINAEAIAELCDRIRKHCRAGGGSEGMG